VLLRRRFDPDTGASGEAENARVAGRSRDEFIALMNGLQLPPPVRIQEAVPANRACGRVAGADV
jgi:hypothetical protein